MQCDACRSIIPFLTCRGSLAVPARTRMTVNIGNIRARTAVMARRTATRQSSRRS